MASTPATTDTTVVMVAIDDVPVAAADVVVIATDALLLVMLAVEFVSGDDDGVVDGAVVAQRGNPVE